MGCDYDHEVLYFPKEEAKQAVVVFFVGGVTYMEIAALRYLAKKVGKERRVHFRTTSRTS